MANIDAIIEQILAAARAKGGRAFPSETVFGDEPILRRGSQLASFRPEPIRRMRALGLSPEARRWSDARLFVEQARLMADYEDDFPYHGTFSTYFPTYDAMDDRQLRGYFTWRTKVRSGVVERTSTSFAYVYLYELINGVGAEPGEGAFRAIEAFWRAYRAFEPATDRYVRPWLVDYAVYHDLDPALALPYADAGHDRAVEALARAQAEVLSAPPQPRGRRRTPRSYGGPREEGLLAALDELSTYRVRESRLFRDEPEALRAVCCAVFDHLVRYYHASRSQDLVESLFGARRTMPHLMFSSAVFCPEGPHPDATYELGARRYECRRGIWSCEALHDGGGRSARLGQVLRATDRQLRAALDYPHPLKERGDPKYLVQIVDREVADYLAWRDAHAPRRVEIDLSKLAGIRSAAAVTREALLVDEEREEGAAAAEGGPAAGASGPVATVEPVGAGGPVAAAEGAPAAGAVPAGDAAPGAGAAGAPFGLTADELSLVRALLDGAPVGAGGTDLMVDSVNEKLFDLLGDTALEFDEAGAPVVVADYADELRSALP